MKLRILVTGGPVGSELRLRVAAGWFRDYRTASTWTARPLRLRRTEVQRCGRKPATIRIRTVTCVPTRRRKGRSSASCGGAQNGWHRSRPSMKRDFDIPTLGTKIPKLGMYMTWRNT